MTLIQFLSNSKKQNNAMELLIQDKIKTYFERRFRASRSFETKYVYKHAINRFADFGQTHYDIDFSQLLVQINEGKRDPIEVLDQYYSFINN